jgi:hypothetical protein
MIFYEPVILKSSIRVVKNILLEIRFDYNKDHRLSINKPTKRGKEKFPFDGHCQCEKAMDDHLLACQQILEKEPHSDTLG